MRGDAGSQRWGDATHPWGMRGSEPAGLATEGLQDRARCLPTAAQPRRGHGRAGRAPSSTQRRKPGPGGKRSGAERASPGLALGERCSRGHPRPWSMCSAASAPQSENETGPGSSPPLAAPGKCTPVM